MQVQNVSFMRFRGPKALNDRHQKSGAPAGVVLDPGILLLELFRLLLYSVGRLSQTQRGGEAAVIFPAIRQGFQCRLTRSTSSAARPSRCLLFCFFLLIPFVLGSAQEKKGCGEVFDREALRRVRTACVDTSYLEGADALAIKDFVARENQPRQLLSQIPWKLTDQCAAADAVIRVYFAQSELLNREEGHLLRGGLPTITYSEQVIQAVLLIYDRASVRVLYRTEGHNKGTNRAALLKGPFLRLVKDLKGANRLTVP